MKEIEKVKWVIHFLVGVAFCWGEYHSCLSVLLHEDRIDKNNT